MNAASFALEPLLLIPAIGLLILSTTARFGQLEGQLRQVDTHDLDIEDETLAHLCKRAVLFQRSLILMYVSIVLFVISALFVPALTTPIGLTTRFSELLTYLGVCCILGAAIFLIAETRLSTEVFVARSKLLQARRTRDPQQSTFFKLK